MLSSIAVIAWINTQPGEWINDFCYKLILLTGIAVVVINLNPLIKLDGYYFFAEWVRPRSQGAFHVISHRLDSAPYFSPPRRRTSSLPAAGAAIRALCPGFRRLQLLAAMAVRPLQLQRLLPLVRRARAGPGGGVGILHLSLQAARAAKLRSGLLPDQGRRGGFPSHASARCACGRLTRPFLSAHHARAPECLLRHRAPGHPPGACRRSGKGPRRVCERGRRGEQRAGDGQAAESE